MNLVKRDTGSVLLWTIGVLLVVASVFVALASLLTLTLQKRELQALADSVALEAVSQIDTSVFSESGATDDLVINTANARALALTHIRQSRMPVSLEEFVVNRDQVQVMLTSQWSDLTSTLTSDVSASSAAAFTPESSG